MIDEYHGAKVPVFAAVVLVIRAVFPDIVVFCAATTLTALYSKQPDPPTVNCYNLDYFR